MAAMMAPWIGLPPDGAGELVGVLVVVIVSAGDGGLVIVGAVTGVEAVAGWRLGLGAAVMATALPAASVEMPLMAGSEGARASELVSWRISVMVSVCEVDF